jgi:hypothetical protein
MKILLASLSLIALLSCNQINTGDKASDEMHLQNIMDKMKTNNTDVVTVLEAIDAGDYTYVRLKDGEKKFWGAITAREVETGKAYAYSNANIMLNFESKTLHRTFDTIYFIQHFAEISSMASTNLPEHHRMHRKHGAEKTSPKNVYKIKPVEGGLSVKEVYSGENVLDGNRIVVSGEVVKINKNILNRHWIHIQDGSSDDENGNLTITTPLTLDFGIGDVITFTGIVSYNKDFGAGYKYRAIVEDAKWEKFVEL